MKIALIGKINQLYWLENTYDALSLEGYDALKITVNRLGLMTDLKRNFLKQINYSSYIKVNIEAVEKKLYQYNPDVILVISPMLLGVELSELISTYDRADKLAWVGDRFTIKALPVLKNYDHVFLTDSGFLKLADIDKEIKVSYLPLAANHIRFKNYYHERNDQILFVGSSTANRNHFFSSVPSSMDIKLIGNRWKARLDNQVKNHFEIDDSKINIDQVAQFYKNANFILNIKHAENVINGINMRTFEAMCSGCCVMNDNCTDLNLFFEHKKELLVYQDSEHLYDLWESYRNDREALFEIQSNAEKIILAKHTYRHRVQEIIKSLN